MNDNLRRRLVTEWQRPIYNLAYRLLGNESDAADATQEVFVHLLERLDRYDPRQELGPWVLRVATNRIRDLMRRQRRQRDLPNPEPPESPSPLAREQKRELDLALRTHVARLTDTVRLPLVLHYYSGLTVAEVAEVLDLATSTVHSRIQSGLQKLQQSLTGRGFALPAVITPALLEQTMRSAPSLPVPAPISAGLAQLAATTAASSPVTILASAGVLMKSPMITAAIVGLVSLLVGFGLHDVVYPTSSGATLSPNPTASTELAHSTEEITRLQGEVQEMTRTVESLRTENERLTQELQARAQAAAANQPPTETAATPTEKPTTVDWARLSDVLAMNLELLKIRGLDDADLTREQEESLATLWKEWAEAGAIAREQNPYAFLDEEFLPGILSVVLGETLDLTDTQIARITDHALDNLARNAPTEDTTPLEAYALRQEIILGVQTHLEDTLGGTQRENYDQMSSWVTRLLAGEQQIRILGLQEEEATRNRIRRAWRKSYGYERGQVPEIDRIIDGFLTSQRRILHHFDQLGNSPRELSTEEHRRMKAERTALALETEKRILPYLTAAQRESLPQSSPMLIRVRDDGSILVGTTGYQGF